MHAAALCLLLAAPPSPEQLSEGWIMLFDGETTFGWKIDGEAKVEKGKLVVGGEKATTITTTTAFGPCEIEFDLVPVAGAKLRIHESELPIAVIGKGVHSGTAKSNSTPRGTESNISVSFGDMSEGSTEGSNTPDFHRYPVGFTVPAGKTITVDRVWLKPVGTKPIFNGKDLAGWKEFPGRRSKFGVTPEGWLNVKDGPGDLATESQYSDFVLQIECISNGDKLNSGIFFRCIPNEYQQGYEAQIQNGWFGNRAKPIDFGTGAIYRRQPARKVIPNDKEWFAMTVIAHDNHIATWVNGYQTADFTDDRPAADNVRKGAKAGKGTVSIQGHDPTTDLSFRNLRIVELPPKK